MAVAGAAVACAIRYMYPEGQTINNAIMHFTLYTNEPHEATAKRASRLRE